MSPESYFNSKAIPLNLANKSLYGANMILGDGLMVWNEPVQIPCLVNHRMQIYRLWMIYGRSWLVVALPILLTMATACTFSFNFQRSCYRNSTKTYEKH